MSEMPHIPDGYDEEAQRAHEAEIVNSLPQVERIDHLRNEAITNEIDKLKVIISKKDSLSSAAKENAKKSLAWLERKYFMDVNMQEPDFAGHLLMDKIAEVRKELGI